MTTSALTRCPRCSTIIRMKDVVGATNLDDDYVSVGMQCGECTLSTHMRVDKATWLRILGTKTEAHVEATISPSRSEAARASAIGRAVKAFALVDLAGVDTVEDIELLWGYQEAVAPDTVRVEV